MDLLIGIASVVQPYPLFILVIGIVIGLIFGTVPGLSGITAVALLVPFSYSLGPEAAIIMMIGVYIATSTAGGIAGSLFNMPGDVMGAATAQDGYPMTRKGEAGRAISMQITASAIGGIIGTIMLVLLAPQFLRIALNFGSPEFFALALLGLACVASLSEGSMPKALIACVLGLLLATVGFDPVSGAARFTFGNQALQGGVDFIPAIIGFFAVSEILTILFRGGKLGAYASKDIKKIPRVALPSLADLKHVRFTILRSSVIGNLVGILPGAGSTIAAFLGYGIDRQISKNPERYGKGEIRGVAAPESANNAAAAGSMMPLMVLGIPGGAVTAIMLGVFIINGLRPGPQLFQTSPDLVHSIYGAFFIGAILALIVGLLSVRFLLRLLTIPFSLFAAAVLVFAVVGTFSLYNRPMDLWVMLACGVLGFFAKRYQFSIAALILGLVLGDIAEVGLVNGIGVSRGDWGEFFTRPFTMGVLIAAVLLLFLPIVIKLISRGRKDETDHEDDDSVATAHR